MLKLPIGIQTLRHIIDGGYAYVDKTDIAFQLIDQGKYYFLSRPRRFGKSLFIDTLKEIFEGNKRLFTGLYIADKWNFEDTYPVIRLSFGAGTWKTVDEMHRSVQWALQWEGKTLGVQVPDGLNYKEQFDALIRLTREQYGKEVVVLIDEYDKPILDNITDKDTARAIRDDIKNLYATIKDNDANIRFVFITGVSKFSKLNLFSGLNNLNDITLSPAYGDICGYTHTDITTTFGPHFEDVDMEKVKEWYNGYNYFGEKVYNPFDILLFLANDKAYKSYWWTTGNTTFLIDLIRTKNYTIPELENYEATEAILDSFDVDSIELAALLWQTGYLTIKDTYTIGERLTYRLGVPNKEIQLS